MTIHKVNRERSTIQRKYAIFYCWFIRTPHIQLPCATRFGHITNRRSITRSKACKGRPFCRFRNTIKLGCRLRSRCVFHIRCRRVNVRCGKGLRHRIICGKEIGRSQDVFRTSNNPLHRQGHRALIISNRCGRDSGLIIKRPSLRKRSIDRLVGGHRQAIRHACIHRGDRLRGLYRGNRLFNGSKPTTCHLLVPFRRRVQPIMTQERIRGIHA